MWTLRWTDLSVCGLEHSPIVLQELIKILDKCTMAFTTAYNNIRRLAGLTISRTIPSCTTLICRPTTHHSHPLTLSLQAHLMEDSCLRTPEATQRLTPSNLHLAVPRYHHNTDFSQGTMALRPYTRTIPQTNCICGQPLTSHYCRKLKSKIQ
jgi:hypothetical protein